MADLCEATGGDFRQVADGIGLDNHIGRAFLKTGPGYGGSCFPKDTLAIAKTGQDYNSPLRLVETTSSINDQPKRAMSRKVIGLCGGDVHGKRIGILGLTFKPNTDDMRDAPFLAIIQVLITGGAKIFANDTQGMEAVRQMLSGVEFMDDAYKIADNADCLVVATESSEFHSLDFARLKRLMKTAKLVDLRNVYDADEMAKHGFEYKGVGYTPFLNDQRFGSKLITEESMK